MIRNALDAIAEVLTHLFRHLKAVFLLHEIAYAALAGLTVDADDITIVLAAHIMRIDIEIGYSPAGRIFFFAPFHALGNRILMRAGECCKYQLTGIRLACMDLHARHALIHLNELRHTREIKLRIHAEREHIHGNRHDIRIACTLAIAKECSFDTVCTGQEAHL